MFGKLLVFSLLLQSALLLPFLEKELNADAKYLNMSSRGLKEILDLATFAHLEEADFSNNAIELLDWERLADAPVLKRLNLAGNLQLTLPEAGPPVDLALSVLNMSYCNVRIIAKHALERLNSLEVLDLRENPIAFEQSPVFEALAAPPKVLIVSKLSKPELRYVCQHVDMQVKIIDDDEEVDCKDVRRDDVLPVAASPNREKLSRDILVDNLLVSDTHMEMEMPNDQPDNGSGDAYQQLDSEELNNSTDAKQDSDEVVPDATDDTPVETQTETETTTDEGTTEANNAAEEEDGKNDGNNEGDARKGEITVQIANPESDDAVRNNSTDVEHSAADNLQDLPEPEEKPLEEDIHPSKEETPETPDVNKTEEELVGGKTEDDKLKGQITAQIMNPDSEHHDEHHRHHAHHHEMADPKQEVQDVQVQAKQPVLLETGAKAGSIDIAPSLDASDAPPLGETKSADSSSTGKNVILVLVIGAVVMGSVFGLMKVYKDRQHNTAAYEEAKCCEMIELSPERKPLMLGTPFRGSCGALATDDVVAEPAEKTAMEILANVPNSGLPDIDDPNRLSTIIVSTTNLSDAK